MFRKIWKAAGLHINIDTHRVYGLDILRAFAITSVVVTHGMAYAPKVFNTILERIYIDGVSLFFVLSGFLIGNILIKSLRTQNANFYTLINFWWRRWLRTLPAYFFVLTAVIISYNYNKPPGPTFKRFYIFSQNLFTPHPGFFIEAWSLSVEEWFYLLIPVLLFALIRLFKIKLPAAVLIISVLIIAFSTIIRVERYFDNLPITPLKRDFLFRMQVVTRLDSLMCGVLAALASVYSYNSWIKNKGNKLIAGILLLVISKALTQVPQNQFLIFYGAVIRFSADAIGAVLLLPYLSTYKHGKGSIYRIITYISLISYSMYLLNLTPLQDYIIPFINRSIAHIATDPQTLKNIDLVLFYLLIIPLSLYSYKFIESPFIKLRNKFTFGKRPSPAV